MSAVITSLPSDALSLHGVISILKQTGFGKNHESWWWWLFSRIQGFVWKIFDETNPSCDFFLSFFSKVGISNHTPIPLFKPGSVQSGSVSSDDYGRGFPDNLHVSSFPWQVPTLRLDGNNTLVHAVAGERRCGFVVVVFKSVIAWKVCDILKSALLLFLFL